MSAIWDTYKYGKDNPFYNEPVQLAYYHPSPPQKTDRTTKQTFISLGCSTDKLPLEDENSSHCNGQNGGIYHMSKVGELGLSPEVESVSFNESWPQTEKPSMLSISEYENTTSLSTHFPERPYTVQKKEGNQISKIDFRDDEVLEEQKSSDLQNRGKESILSKYISRFRHAQPLSRAQRAKVIASDPDDFWWLHSPVSQRSLTDLSHIPTDAEPFAVQNSLPLLEFPAELKKAEVLIHKDYDGNKLSHVEKKDVLDKISSNSTGSSYPAVSTVGLGSDMDSIHTEELPFRPTFILNSESQSRGLPQSGRPEDDILYRWRLRRQREVAKERITNFRMEANYNQSFHHSKLQTAETVTSIGQKIKEQQQPLTDYHKFQKHIKEPQSELKRDAIIQTSGDFDQVLPLTVACPHTSSRAISCLHFAPGTIPCHLNLAENLPKKNTQQEPFTNAGGDSKKIASHREKNSMSDEKESSKMKTGIALCQGNGGNAQNIAKEEKGISELKTEKDSEKQHFYHSYSQIKSLPQHESVISHLPKADHVVICSRHELSDTDVWRTTDNEAKNSFKKEKLQSCREKKKNSRRKDSRAGVERQSGLSKSVIAAATGILSHNKRSLDKEKRNISSKHKHNSSLILHEAADQISGDQLLVTSVSSIENLEFSSLDLKRSLMADDSDVEEPTNNKSSARDSDELFVSAEADLESVLFSDGEEFEEDDILCSLRERRSLCVQRLKDLDQLLKSRKTSAVNIM